MAHGSFNPSHTSRSLILMSGKLLSTTAAGVFLDAAGASAAAVLAAAKASAEVREPLLLLVPLPMQMLLVVPEKAGPEGWGPMLVVAVAVMPVVGDRGAAEVERAHAE